MLYGYTVIYIILLAKLFLFEHWLCPKWCMWDPPLSWHPQIIMATFMANMEETSCSLSSRLAGDHKIHLATIIWALGVESLSRELTPWSSKSGPNARGKTNLGPLYIRGFVSSKEGVFSLAKRGNYRIQAYLLAIQHKNLISYMFVASLTSRKLIPASNQLKEK